MVAAKVEPARRAPSTQFFVEERSLLRYRVSGCRARGIEGGRACPASAVQNIKQTKNSPPAAARRGPERLADRFHGLEEDDATAS